MMRTVRRAWRGLAVLGAALALSGCIEVVQHVGLERTGRLANSVRVTLQRGLFTFAESMGGEPFDPDAFTGEAGMSREQVLRTIPASARPQFKPVVTEFDLGFELTTSTDRSFSDAAVELVPMLSGGELRIRLPASEGKGGDESAALFLSSSKYRLLIDKSVLPQVSQAFVRNSESGEIPVDVSEYQSVWLIEFPVLFWLSGGQDPMVIVRR